MNNASSSWAVKDAGKTRPATKSKYIEAQSLDASPSPIPRLVMLLGPAGSVMLTALPCSSPVMREERVCIHERLATVSPRH